jgi:hypothetical protein
MTFTEASTATPRSQPRSDRAAYDVKRTTDWLEERIAAGKKSPVAEVITLTVALAELLVSDVRNQINRPLSGGNEASLLSDIANQRFEFNGESIVVSDTGKLLDGQHRCYSVIKSGIPIQTVIVFGPKEDARFTIDIGRPKSASNFLAMKGHKYTAMLASTARLVLIYRAFDSLVTGGADSYKTAPTKTEVVNAVSQLRGLEASVEFTSVAPKALGSKSILAFAHYIIAKKSSRENADYFFQKMFEVAQSMAVPELKDGHPIRYCVRRIPDVGSNGGTTGLNARAELIFKCWNGYRRGEAPRSISLNGRLPKVER